jgi:hypothetical protein
MFLTAHQKQSGLEDDVQICVEHFQKSYSLRKPYIHSQTIISPFLSRELKMAMASLGASGMPGYTTLARTFYEDACYHLQESTDPVSHSELELWLQSLKATTS